MSRRLFQYWFRPAAAPTVVGTTSQCGTDDTATTTTHHHHHNPTTTTRTTCENAPVVCWIYSTFFDRAAQNGSIESPRHFEQHNNYNHNYDYERDDESDFEIPECYYNAAVNRNCARAAAVAGSFVRDVEGDGSPTKAKARQALGTDILQVQGKQWQFLSTEQWTGLVDATLRLSVTSSVANSPKINNNNNRTSINLRNNTNTTAERSLTFHERARVGMSNSARSFHEWLTQDTPLSLGLPSYCMSSATLATAAQVSVPAAVAVTTTTVLAGALYRAVDNEIERRVAIRFEDVVHSAHSSKVTSRNSVTALESAFDRSPHAARTHRLMAEMGIDVDSLPAADRRDWTQALSSVIHQVEEQQLTANKTTPHHASTTPMFPFKMALPRFVG